MNITSWPGPRPRAARHLIDIIVIFIIATIIIIIIVPDGHLSHTSNDETFTSYLHIPHIYDQQRWNIYQRAQFKTRYGHLSHTSNDKHSFRYRELLLF